MDQTGDNPQSAVWRGEWSSATVVLVFALAGLAIAFVGAGASVGLDLLDLPSGHWNDPQPDLCAKVKSFAVLVLGGMLLFCVSAGVVYVLGSGYAALLRARAGALILNFRIFLSFFLFSYSVFSLLLHALSALAGSDFFAPLHPWVVFYAFIAGFFVLGIMGIVIERKAPRVWDMIESRAYTATFARTINLCLWCSLPLFILVNILIVALPIQ